MSIHALAGKPAPYEYLINVPRLISAYYTHQPDPGNPAHQVAFGTSGHRGSSLNNSFNEAHILAISQAICEQRKSQGISGPLYLGMDTHALSEPALYTAIEVFCSQWCGGHHPAGSRLYPYPGHLTCHPDLQPRTHSRPGGWRGDHTFSQSARRWRLQI